MSYEVSPRLIFNSVCLALAAVLFLIPGLLTDLLALALIAPMVRTGLFRIFSPHFEDGVEDYRQRRGPSRPRDKNIIEGEFTRVESNDN